MCSHCLAGDEAIPFERADYDPIWKSTLHSSRPWAIAPDISLIKFDLFHLWKVGLGRDLAGSAILVWCRLGLFDDPDPNCQDYKNIEDRLERAHNSFRLWCMANSKSPGLRSFSKAFLNSKSYAHSAWSNSKGSDTTLLNQWLCWFAKLHLQMPTQVSMQHEHMLRTFVHTSQASFDMFDVLYSHGVWLNRSCAKLVYLKILQLMRGYKSLAHQALQLNIVAWGMKPKFHALHYVYFDLRSQLQKGCKLCLNPIVWGNEQNEDTIGRVSRLSKVVSVRTITQRVLNRYFLKKRALLKRHAILGKKGADWNQSWPRFLPHAEDLARHMPWSNAGYAGWFVISLLFLLVGFCSPLVIIIWFDIHDVAFHHFLKQ